MKKSSYIGRFAPSPSGKLHIGSMLSAYVSFIDAKHNNGQWKLRIDDIDKQRSKNNFAENIIGTLHDFNLVPDEIYYQNDHIGDYQKYFNAIPEEHKYFCQCTRKKLSSLPKAPIGRIYNEACKNEKLDTGAIRLDSKNMPLQVEDIILGQINLPSEHVSDFIIKQKNGFSYLFCCVVDDFLQNVTHVVRGADLIYQTLQQNFLYAQLNLLEPQYIHHPLLTRNKKKISKSDQAEPVDSKYRIDILLFVLKILKQPIPNSFKNYEDLLNIGIQNWNLKLIPRHKFIEID